MSMIHIQNPQTESSLTNVEPQDIQPNAVDIRLDKIFQIQPTRFCINETAKVHRGSIAIKPSVDLHGAEYWLLKPGVYEAVATNHIVVGENEAGFVITRSTLNRNGVYITSGLYDSGYSGVCAMALHITTGEMLIERNTRIGQFILFDSQMIGKYSGDYGLNSDGSFKAHDVKYAS